MARIHSSSSAHSLNAFHGGDRDKVLLWFYRCGNGQAHRELISYHKFGEKFSARKFIDAAVGDYETKWLDERTLRVRDWFNIVSDLNSHYSLEQVMEHKLTKEEDAWQLPIPYTGYAKSINQYHWGSHPDVNQHALRANHRPPLTEEERIKMGGEPRAEIPAPVKREKKERKERKERQPRAEGITLASVCTELKVDPREARAALRDANISKPEGGWVWKTKEDVPDIAKLVAKRKKR